MPKFKDFSVLVDATHKEILNYPDEDFRSFWSLLTRMGCSILPHDLGKITSEILKDIDLLLIGCPVNRYFLTDEIHSIIDFVIAGGNLFVMSEYGGDSVQKTNLNDLMGNFGIYFENTAIRASGTNGFRSLLMITDIVKHEITKNVRKIILGGCSSLRIAKDAITLCYSSLESSRIDIYDDLNNKWIEYKNGKVPLIGLTVYGQGRVCAIGDIDIFSDNSRFGIQSGALDNRRLIRNIIQFFQSQMHSEITIEWILKQIAFYRDENSQINETLNKLIKTVKKLEKKFSSSEVSHYNTERTFINPVETHLNPEKYINSNSESSFSETYNSKNSQLEKLFNNNLSKSLKKVSNKKPKIV